MSELDEDLLVKDFGSLSAWKILQLQGLLSEESDSQVKVVVPQLKTRRGEMLSCWTAYTGELLNSLTQDLKNTLGHVSPLSLSLSLYIYIYIYIYVCMYNLWNV
jgi:hypothetical protein